MPNPLQQIEDDLDRISKKSQEDEIAKLVERFSSSLYASILSNIIIASSLSSVSTMGTSLSYIRHK